MLSTLIGLLAPLDCALCGSVGTRLCAKCSARLQPAVASRRGLKVRLAAGHSPELVRWLVAWKDGGRHSDTGELARLLLPALRLPPATSDFALAPVPARRAGRRRRGWEPVPALAAALADLAGLPYRPCLDWRRQPLDQRGLGANDRAANLRDALLAGDPPAQVLVLDDLLTSGATLRACQAALSAAGALSVSLLAVTTAHPDWGEMKSIAAGDRAGRLLE